MKTPKFIYLLLFWLSLSSIAADNYNIRVERVSLEEGISHNMVLSVMQDSRGFMWFGTMFGLIKYDGLRYTVYRHNPSDSTTLTNDDIITMFEDKRGNLWAGAFGGGLNKFNRSKGEFVRYEVDFFGLDSLWNGKIWALEQDADSNIWIATDGAGIIKMDPVTEEFSIYRNDHNNPYSITDNFINDIFLDSQGFLWFGTGDGYISVYSPNDDGFINFSLSKSLGIKDITITDIYEDAGQQFWIGTNKGMFLFDKINRRFTRFQNEEIRQLDNIAVNKILEDREGRIWFGTGNGLYLLSPGDNTIRHIYHNPSNPNSLSGNTVISIYEDDTGIIWVGNYLGGVDKIYVDKDKFEHFRKIPNDEYSLSSNQVFEFAEDNEGYIWIATSSGLNLFVEQSGRFMKFFHNPNNPKSISDNSVRTIAVDDEGILWVGTENGLDRINPYTRSMKHYKHNPDDSSSISSNLINKLYFDRDGILWVGTGNGLNRFNPGDETFSKYLPDDESPSSISAFYISSIYEDSKGYLWIATYRGLNKFNKRTKEFVKYTKDSPGPNNISSDLTFAIHESKDGTLWIGTGNGLNKYHRETGTFEHFMEKDGLPNPVICGILEDDKGYLYLSTHRGVSKFDPVNETFANYDIDDGLQSNMFMQGSYFKKRNGDMYFGGINGFNRFNADNMEDNLHVPPVYITAIKKYDEELPLEMNYSEVEEIEFPYDVNFITIEFAALDYFNPAKNNYAYMLEGLDDDYNYVGNINYASYTNLNPGTYNFRVKASNSDGIWNPEPTTIRLTIHPPFWQTWWFFIGVLLMSISILFIAHLQRVRSEISKALEIKQAREQENEKVRKKAADDFHDELGHRVTKISLYSEIMKRNGNGMPQQHIDYINKILETSKTLSFGMRDFIWTLDPEKDSLHEVLIRLKDFGDEVFDKTGVAFRVQGIRPELQDIKLPMDWRRHLTLIFKEAMNNILKYAKCTNVTLDVDVEGDTIRMALSDDGQGIDMETEHKGRGLRSMKKRANSINGDIEIITRLGEGTTVEFTGEMEKVH